MLTQCAVTDPSTMRISVAGNVKSLSKPKTEFAANFEKLKASLSPRAVKRRGLS